MPTPPTSRWRNARSELIIAALLLVLAVALGAFLFKKPSLVAPTAVPNPSPVVASPVVTPEASSPPPSLASSPSETSVVTLEITNKTQTKNYILTVTEPITVADLMTQAARGQSLQITTKDFGGSLGLFFESIDGRKNDTTTNQYWSLYLNNTKSAVGASTAVVHPGDIVSWRYEKGI